MNALGQIIEELEIMQIVFVRKRWKTRRRRRRDLTEGDLKVELRWGDALKHVSEHDCLCDGIGRIPAFKKKSCERSRSLRCTQSGGVDHMYCNIWSGSERKGTVIFEVHLKWIPKLSVIKKMASVGLTHLRSSVSIRGGERSFSVSMSTDEEKRSKNYVHDDRTKGYNS